MIDNGKESMATNTSTVKMQERLAAGFSGGANLALKPVWLVPFCFVRRGGRSDFGGGGIHASCSIAEIPLVYNADAFCTFNLVALGTIQLMISHFALPPCADGALCHSSHHFDWFSILNAHPFAIRYLLFASFSSNALSTLSGVMGKSFQTISAAFSMASTILA